MHAPTRGEWVVVTSELQPSDAVVVATWARQSLGESVVVTHQWRANAVLCVASRGLSKTCCAARQAGVSVVAPTITTLQRQNGPIGALLADATRARPFVLKQLGGYRISLTGFTASDASKESGTHRREAVTQALEMLGAEVLPRLDLTVDILVVPWTVHPRAADVGECCANAVACKTAKVQFAIKHKIPIVSADALLEDAAAGYASLEAILSKHAYTATIVVQHSVAATSSTVSVDAVSDVVECDAPSLRPTASNLEPPVPLGEPPVTKLPSSPLGGANTEPCASHGATDHAAHTHDDDGPFDDTLAICFPIVFVCFGVTDAEHVAVRKLVSMLHPLAILEQPVVTGLTTHVIAGSAIEALVAVPGNQEVLEQFLMQFQRLSPSRLKTFRWLQALCGVSLNSNLGTTDDDEDAFLVVDGAAGSSVVQRLRDHFDGHCLLPQRGGLLRPRMELDGFLEPNVVPEQRPQQGAPLSNVPKNRGTLPAAPLVKTTTPSNVAASDGRVINKEAARPRKQEPQCIVPELLLLELIDLLHIVWPTWTPTHQDGTGHPSSVDARLAALLSQFEANNLTRLFQGVTFLCEDVESSRQTDGRGDGTTLSSGDANIFTLHRLAALRLILKSCGGTLIRKTQNEIAEMMERKDELFRPKRPSSGDAKRVYHCLALVPHAFESCPSPAARRSAMRPVHSGHTLRSANMAQRGATATTAPDGGGSCAVVYAHVTDVAIPQVTSTWVLACVSIGVRLPSPIACVSKRSSARNRLLRMERGLPLGAERVGMQFLRQIPSQVHPYADIITSVSAKNLEASLPCPPSPFLTTLRYVKHQLRGDLAATGDDAALGNEEVGQGIHVMCVGHKDALCEADLAHLEIVCKSLGGCLERASSSDGGVPFHRVTHVVTDCTVLRQPVNADECEPPEGQTDLEAAGRFELDTMASDADDDVNGYLLHCVAMMSTTRPDIVLVDASWLRASVSLGYFVGEDEYRVHPRVRRPAPTAVGNDTALLPPREDASSVLQTTNDGGNEGRFVSEQSGHHVSTLVTPVRLKSNPDGAELELLPDALTSAVRSIEASVGEGNAGRGRPTKLNATTSAASASIKREGHQSALRRVAPREAQGTEAGDGPATRQAAYESPTAVHPVLGGAPAIVEEAVSDEAWASNGNNTGRGARVYVLSSVPKFAELKVAIESKLSEPVLFIPTTSSNVEPCVPPSSTRRAQPTVAPHSPSCTWTHLVWATSSADADVVISNEITQRESVLFAMAAGLWLVTDAFIWDSVKAMRLCDVARYEWSVALLPPAEARKRACAALAQNVSWWRRLRQQAPVPVLPFSGPCIQHIVLVSSPLSSVLGSILDVGGGRVTILGGADSTCQPAADGVVDACTRAVTRAMHPDLDGNPQLDAVASCACKCGPSIIVLMSKELLSACGEQLRSRFDECVATFRTIADASGNAPGAAAESRAACHYAGHDPSRSQPRAIAIEVHAHDWVSLVLQRRSDKLSDPLMLCE